MLQFPVTDKAYVNSKEVQILQPTDFIINETLRLKTPMKVTSYDTWYQMILIALIPVPTDVHEPSMCNPVAMVVLRLRVEQWLALENR